MRATVGNTWLFQYVLIFTIIFAAFLALAISYNRVFKVKNEMLSIMEKYEGVKKVSNDKAIGIMNSYLKNSGYTNKGECEIGEAGVASLDTPSYTIVQKSGEKYYYCLKSEKNTNNKNNTKIYYTVKVFFKFDLPVLGELFQFKITGKTDAITYYSYLQVIK